MSDSQKPPGDRSTDLPAKAEDTGLLEPENEVIESVVNGVVRLVEREVHMGPLPAPQTLREYEELVPGTARNFMEAFFEEGRHRRNIEKRVIRGNNILGYMGSLFGFIIGAGGVAGSVWLLSQGYTLGGLGAVIASFGSLVAVFLGRSRRKSPELPTVSTSEDASPSAE